MKKSHKGWLFLSVEFLVFKLPSFIVWVSLTFLSLAGYYRFLSPGNFTPVLTLYLTAIALIVAFASVTFSYAKTQDRKGQESLVVIGELFLYASITLTMSLLVSWSSFEIRDYLKNIKYYDNFSFILILVFSWGQYFLYYVADSLHRAVVDLERHLHSKVREKIR